MLLDFERVTSSVLVRMIEVRKFFSSPIDVCGNGIYLSSTMMFCLIYLYMIRVLCTCAGLWQMILMNIYAIFLLLYIDDKISSDIGIVHGGQYILGLSKRNRESILIHKFAFSWHTLCCTLWLGWPFMDYIPFVRDKFTCSIGVIFYETKLFWSICKMLMGSYKTIHSVFDAWNITQS